MDEERNQGMDEELDEELDEVVFEDDAGNEIRMEVLAYLAYEGKRYAFLTPVIEDDDEPDEDEDMDVYVMEVIDVDDDMEEFVQVEDEELADQLLEIFQSDDFDEIYDDEDEED